MTIQYSVARRNARLDSDETTIGTAPLLRILSGSPPADCATAQSGTLLCEMTLPSDWLAAASGGVKAKSGTWQGTAVAAGTAGYFRILNSAGSTCHEQGTVGLGSGDMSLDNTSIGVGQTVTVTTYSRTASGA